MTTTHAEWVKLSNAAQAAIDAFDAQADVVARLHADLAAAERVLTELGDDRDDAIAAEYEASQSEAAVTAYLAAEYARRPDDATCTFCDAPTTALVIGAFGTRYRACTAHTANAFEAANSDIDPERDAWEAAQAARGPLAGAPDTMPCHACGGPDRAVIGLGPVAEPHRDPTQTYKLACGHTAI